MPALAGPALGLRGSLGQARVNLFCRVKGKAHSNSGSWQHFRTDPGPFVQLTGHSPEGGWALASYGPCSPAHLPPLCRTSLPSTSPGPTFEYLTAQYFSRPYLWGPLSSPASLPSEGHCVIGTMEQRPKEGTPPVSICRQGLCRLPERQALGWK